MGAGFGVLSGTMSNGQVFYTPQALSELGGHDAAGHSLEAAVSAALAAPTGSVAGTMASGTVATLLVAYNAAVAGGL